MITKKKYTINLIRIEKIYIASIIKFKYQMWQMCKKLKALMCEKKLYIIKWNVCSTLKMTNFQIYKKLTCAVVLIEFIWLFIVVGGLGGGPDGLCVSDLKNISRFDCNCSDKKRYFVGVKTKSFFFFWF